MAFLMIFFLYKKGFFNFIFEQFNNQKQHSNLNQDNLLENKKKSSKRALLALL